MMRILYFRAGSPERLAELDGSLEALRALLGGPRERTRLDGGMLLVSRAENARFLPNRMVRTEFSGEQMIYGSFAVCGRDPDDHPASLPLSCLGELAQLIEPFPGPPRCILCGREAELPEIHGVSCCRRHIAGFLRDWTAETPTREVGHAG